MNGFRIKVRAQCQCPEGGHDAIAFRTATDGLVVAQWVHRHTSEPYADDRWTILHHATGLVLPRDFGDPESAMACAGALSADGDWVDVDPVYDREAALSTLVRHGGESWGACGDGPREQLNEVMA